MRRRGGGWEIWLQCELAHFFDYQAQREVNVWDDERACDLYFEDTKFVVELKCLGWNVIQTSKKKGGSWAATESSLETFAKRVLADKKKIGDYGGKGISIAVVPTFKDVGYTSLIGRLKVGGYRFFDIGITEIQVVYWAK